MSRMSVIVSIVSHNHGNLISELLNDLSRCTNVTKIIITFNIPEENISIPTSLNNKIIKIYNKLPKGFSSNHNYAFKKYCNSEFFLVLNPDIRFSVDPLPLLINTFENSNCMICAPRVLNIDGSIEDSARYFPKPFTLMLKLFGHDVTIHPQDVTTNLFKPDWIAGMFMLIKSSWFKSNLFDENYFLYYEDIDLCLRCWKSGSTVLLNTNVEVVHDARRDSHTKLFFLYLHLRSICYFFLLHYLRFPKKD